MNIISATYGGVDCLHIVRSKVKGNRLIIMANNDIVGDTSPGNRKSLVLWVGGDHYK